jgi:hypothetical protein
VYAELMDLKRKHSELQDRLRESDVEAVDAARAEATALQNRVDSLEEDAAAARATAASQTAAARQEVARAESALASAMSEVRAQREGSERREAELQSEVAELLRSVSAARAEAERWRDRAAEDSTDTAGAASVSHGGGVRDADSLAPRLRAAQTALEESEAAKRVAERDAASLRASLEAARATCDELRRDAASSRAEAARAVSEVAGAEARAAEQAESRRVRQLHVRLDAVTRTLREKQAELDEGSAGRAALVARLSAMGVRLEEAEAEAEAAAAAAVRGSAGITSGNDGAGHHEEDVIVFEDDDDDEDDAQGAEHASLRHLASATASAGAGAGAGAGAALSVPSGAAISSLRARRAVETPGGAAGAEQGSPSKGVGRAARGSAGKWRGGRSVAVPVSRDSMLLPITGAVPGAKRAIDAADRLCLQAGIRLVTRPRWRLLLMVYLLALHGLVLLSLSWTAHGSAVSASGHLAAPRPTGRDLPGGGDHSGSVLDSLRKSAATGGDSGNGEQSEPVSKTTQKKKRKSLWHHDASDLGA